MQNNKLRKVLNLDGKLRCNLKVCNLQFAICNPPMDGFTLIEVIATLAIVSISLVMVMQLFSSGLRVSRTTCNDTRAIVHAKDKMEELSQTPVQDNGEFEDGFEWETEVQPYEGFNVELEDTDLNLLQLKVKITWFSTAKKKKSIELVSLKTVTDVETE